MIKCPFCSSTYPENTLFCDECGSYLAPGDGQATDPLSGQDSDETKEGKPSSGSIKTLTLALDDGSSVELPLSKEVILGRLDPGRAIFPDVDLTSQDGMDKGVSRRHARQGHWTYSGRIRSLPPRARHRVRADSARTLDLRGDLRDGILCHYHPIQDGDLDQGRDRRMTYNLFRRPVIGLERF